MSAAFGQSVNASPSGHDWNSYSESLKTGYALGFINGASLGAVREVNLCFQLTNISLDIVNTSNEFHKQWKEKYPDIVTAATSQILNQVDRPEFKQDFCLKSLNSGFENITVGQFLSGANAFYRDYRNESIPDVLVIRVDQRCGLGLCYGNNLNVKFYFRPGIPLFLSRFDCCDQVSRFNRGS
jgi:hypothetical protein